MKSFIKHVKVWFSLKSKTLNFSLFLQLTAVVQVYIEGIGEPLATMAVALIIAMLRFKTKKDVHKK